MDVASFSPPVIKFHQTGNLHNIPSVKDSLNSVKDFLNKYANINSVFCIFGRNSKLNYNG
jgi:hypothetical protein